eukprot:8595350-Pyramimonas_sp.AAC.1
MQEKITAARRPQRTTRHTASKVVASATKSAAKQGKRGGESDLINKLLDPEKRGSKRARTKPRETDIRTIITIYCIISSKLVRLFHQPNMQPCNATQLSQQHKIATISAIDFPVVPILVAEALGVDDVMCFICTILGADTKTRENA